MRPRTRRTLGATVIAIGLALAAVAPATADDETITVTIPEPAPTLRWGINPESTGGAYLGGCNFPSAGVAGDSGGAAPWTEASGLYRATEGDVRIEKPDAHGTYRLASWDARCLDANGSPVRVADVESYTGSQVVVGGGVQRVDAATGRRVISWTGSFTLAFYGGMTYWSASDPVLTLEADGTGRLTATVSGYGTDMDDLSKWVPLAPAQVTLADIASVEERTNGLTAIPAYVGVPVTVGAGGQPQARRDDVNAAWWGSFPQSFVDFQQLTGQSSYWFTSGGARDRAKPPLPIVVTFHDTGEPYVAPDPGLGTGASGATSSGGATGGGVGGGSTGTGTASPSRVTGPASGGSSASPRGTVVEQAANAFLASPLATLFGLGDGLIPPILQTPQQTALWWTGGGGLAAAFALTATKLGWWRRLVPARRATERPETEEHAS